MATFPSLTPSGRTFTPGEYPHTPFITYNGFQNRVRHSNVMLSSQVRLSFIALTEAQMLNILSHYQGQTGTYESFDLPSTVWAGVTTISDYQLTGYLWRYIEPPTVEDIVSGRYNVELVLETVPPDGAQVDGLWYIVSATLAAGAAGAASGLEKTVSSALTAAGFELPGLISTVTVSFTPGTGAASSGAQLTVPATFAAGTAAASSGADLTVSATFSAGEAFPVTNGATLNVTISFAAGAATVDASGADYWSDMAVQLYGWEALAYIEWWGN
jgi:hypothetical protein